MLSKLKAFIFRDTLKETFFKSFLQILAVTTLGFSIFWWFHPPALLLIMPRFDFSSLPHGMQLSHSLGIFSPFILMMLITTILTISTSTEKKVAIKKAMQLWGYFLIYMIFIHLYIWLFFFPDCITSNECTLGNNDDFLGPFLIAHSHAPYLLIIGSVVLGRLAKHFKELKIFSSEFHKLVLLVLTFVLCFPLLAMFFLLYPVIMFNRFFS